MSPRHCVAVVCCLLFWNTSTTPAQTGNNKHQAKAQSQATPAASQAGQKSDEPPTCTLSDDDYSVFTSVLEDLGHPEDPEESWQGKDILVKDLTGAGDVDPRQWSAWGIGSKNKAAPSTETQADYNDKSRYACPLKEGWGNANLYKPFEHTELKNYFGKTAGKGDGWEKFYRAHPAAAGYWTFSRPGYNRDRTEALIYVTHSCGWLCGTGHLYFLTRQYPVAKWMVKNRLFLWIS